MTSFDNLVSLNHEYVYNTGFLPLLPLASQLSPDVQADTGFLCDKNAVLRKSIQETPCIKQHIHFRAGAGV